MRIGIPLETRPGETRIAATAETVKKLAGAKHSIVVQAGAGVTVVERVAHQLPANPHNARYLATKRDRSGHLL